MTCWLFRTKASIEINNALSHDIPRAGGGLGFVRKLIPATCVVVGLQLLPSLWYLGGSLEYILEVQILPSVCNIYKLNL